MGKNIDPDFPGMWVFKDAYLYFHTWLVENRDVSWGNHKCVELPLAYESLRGAAVTRKYRSPWCSRNMTGHCLVMLGLPLLKYVTSSSFSEPLTLIFLGEGWISDGFQILSQSTMKNHAHSLSTQTLSLLHLRITKKRRTLSQMYSEAERFQSRCNVRTSLHNRPLNNMTEFFISNQLTSDLCDKWNRLISYTCVIKEALIVWQ